MTLYQVYGKQGNTDQGEEKLVEIYAQVSRKIGDLIILCPEIIYHNVAMNSSVAILAEISYFARNFTQKSDRQSRNIGHEILPKNARNFDLHKNCPKVPEICFKMDENGRNLNPLFEQFFFKKIW